MTTTIFYIQTRSGKFFFKCQSGEGKTTFFYMLPNGERTFSKGELNTGELPDEKEWKWAQKKWQGDTVPKEATGEVYNKALELLKKIERKKYYGANHQELLKMKSAINHRKAPTGA